MARHKGILSPKWYAATKLSERAVGMALTLDSRLRDVCRIEVDVTGDSASAVVSAGGWKPAALNGNITQSKTRHVAATLRESIVVKGDKIKSFIEMPPRRREAQAAAIRRQQSEIIIRRLAPAA